jgi:hypothetical protein
MHDIHLGTKAQAPNERLWSLLDLESPMTEPPSDFETAVRQLANTQVELLLSKHRDYGPTNISNAPGGPLNGLRVRLHDKLARLNHLVDSGADPEHESLADTAADIANYGTILSLVLRGEWPST